MKHNLTNIVILLLSVVAGGAASLALWGGETEGDVKLQAALRRFASLTPEKQDDIRASQKAWAKLNAEEKRKILEVHESVSSHKQLAGTLDHFNAWRTTLERFELDKLQQEVRAGDSAAVGRRMVADQQLSQKIVIPFPELGFRRFMHYRALAVAESKKLEGPQWLPPLILTRDQYARILSNAFPDSWFSESELEELSRLSNEDEHALLKTLLIVERIRDSGSLFDSVRVIVETLRKDAPDPEWRKEFEIRAQQLGLESHGNGSRSRESTLARFPMLIAVLTILDQAVIDLSGDLRRELSPKQDEIVDTFEAIDDAGLRRELMILPPEAAVERLQRMAVGTRAATTAPRRLLYRRRVSYEEKMTQLSQTLQTYMRAFIPVRGDERGRPDQERRPPG